VSKVHTPSLFELISKANGDAPKPKPERVAGTPSPTSASESWSNMQVDAPSVLTDYQAPANHKAHHSGFKKRWNPKRKGNWKPKGSSPPQTQARPPPVGEPPAKRPRKDVINKT